LEHLSEEVLAQPHDPDKSNQTEVAYRLAWARTYLKKFGLLENSTRGVWSLTPRAKEVDKLNPQEVVRAVRAADKKDAEAKGRGAAAPQDAPQDASPEQEWKEKLHAILTQTLSPAAFERLVQRLLRESGFTQVEVTGRSGDGGIDGKGIARIHGLMSFHVLFQCKNASAIKVRLALAKLEISGGRWSVVPTKAYSSLPEHSLLQP
jgi:restriction system protein